MNKLRIAVAVVLTAALGYLMAFGPDFGAGSALASKTTSTSTSYAGKSPNVKGETTIVKAGKGGGGGETKTSTSTTCKPTGNKANNFTC
jgi:hypothetical protein